MWAADFDENAADELEMNCLESLVVHLPKSSDALETSFSSSVGSSQRNSNVAKNGDDTVDRFTSHSNGIKLISSYPFCGLATARLLTRNDRMPASCILSSLKNGDVHLSVFCVAAILISNRQKIIQLTHSLDDLIKASVLFLSCIFSTVSILYFVGVHVSWWLETFFRSVLCFSI